ncbi:DUF3622 domain-containing protein [Amphritea sp. HPY]|uniref:DUF3622 domain-containing protein n=1 Tax=Amphritea sp. HPY TaxID=3421652 RepID=UPI003D7D2C34
MAKGKKYDYRVVQNGTSWTTEIVRQITSKKTLVSKSQDGFTSEDDAKAWGETELKSFTQSQSERNQRRNEQRELKQQAEAEAKAKYAARIEAEAQAELEADLKRDPQAPESE